MSISSTVAPAAHMQVAGPLATVAAFFKALRNRRAFVHIATMDDAQLRDIGLTAADVYYARSLPLGQDPTEALGRLAIERRHYHEISR